MAIKVVAYTDELVPKVAAFNQRMLEGNTGWGWYEQATDDWLPARPGREVWREHYLAMDDEGEVRGAYALKPQTWLIRGETKRVADWQGPVSEGLLSSRHATLGLRLVREMLNQSPMLYSWGHGGSEASLLRLLVSLKWLIHDTPFLLRVCHPIRFLRRNQHLRGSVAQRIALDLLAFSGLGWLGLKALHLGLGLRQPPLSGVEVNEVPRFAEWADTLWDGAKGAYQALGVRDAASMNALIPEDGGWPHGIRLQIRRGDETIGWAVVLDNQLEGDARFGDLRVGCVADCFAHPDDADVVIAAATHFLRRRGVDLIGSNQSHPAWIEAFSRSGYLGLKGRRSFAVSPTFEQAMAPFEQTRTGLHLTNLDGHGPHGF